MFMLLKITPLQKLKEHFDNTSDLIEENIILDIYTKMDWVMC